MRGRLAACAQPKRPLRAPSLCPLPTQPPAGKSLLPPYYCLPSLHMSCTAPPPAELYFTFIGTSTAMYIAHIMPRSLRCILWLRTMRQSLGMQCKIKSRSSLPDPSTSSQLGSSRTYSVTRVLSAALCAVRLATPTSLTRLQASKNVHYQPPPGFVGVPPAQAAATPCGLSPTEAVRVTTVEA